MSNQQQKICLFGGTFDPIHLGHTFIAERVARELGMDKVIFLPCRQSPHKKAKQGAVPADRLQMCQLATQPHEWAEVSDFDLMSPDPSYSWKTAMHFSQLFPQAQIYWLMGADQYRSLDRWSNLDLFRSMVRIIFYTRNCDTPQILQHHDIAIDGVSHPASATSIRKQLMKGTTSHWLSPEVSKFCKENGLYLKSQLD